ncbi:hypothetical protein D3C84_1138330 [compost metagenome]
MVAGRHRRVQPDRRDDRLTRTDIALQQSVHGVRLLHVVQELTHDLLLRLRQLEGERAHEGAYSRQIDLLLQPIRPAARHSPVSLKLELE